MLFVVFGADCDHVGDIYECPCHRTSSSTTTYQNLCQICHTKIQALPAVFEQLHPTESV